MENYLKFCIKNGIIKNVIVLEAMAWINTEKCLHCKYQNCSRQMENWEEAKLMSSSERRHPGALVCRAVGFISLLRGISSTPT